MNSLSYLTSHVIYDWQNIWWDNTCFSRDPWEVREMKFLMFLYLFYQDKSQCKCNGWKAFRWPLSWIYVFIVFALHHSTSGKVYLRILIIYGFEWIWIWFDVFLKYVLLTQVTMQISYHDDDWEFKKHLNDQWDGYLCLMVLTLHHYITI